MAFLVDGQEYFGAVRSAIARAQHSFFILGWDIDSKVKLSPQGVEDGLPAGLGDFLDAVVTRRHGLHGYVLTWDYAMLYALEREWLPIYQLEIKTHQRLSFQLDDQHPVGASHHQKVIVVDDSVAFVSGFDLARSRWDTPAHAQDDPHRVDNSGKPYAPFHDVGVVLSGAAARALGELCRERWSRLPGAPRSVPAPAAAERGTAAGRDSRTNRTTGTDHDAGANRDSDMIRNAQAGGDPVVGGDPWPDGIAPVLTDVDVAISRTEPAFAERPAVDEVRQLHLEAIASARHWIFGESQYFTSRAIADALARRLASADSPEIAILSPAQQSGWLEAATMGVLRARIHRSLRAADADSRYRLYCPKLAWSDPEGSCLNVHSKVLIVDDEFLTVGSANLSDRSLRLDTECNVSLEARGDPRIRAAIAGLRDRLLAEHLDSTPEKVAAATADTGSLHAVVALLGRPDGRTLVSTEPPLDPTVDAVTPDHGVLDPETPLDPDILVTELLPEPEGKNGVRVRLALLVLLVAALAGIALAWRYTPVRQWLDIDVLAGFAATLSEMPLAPVIVAGAFVVGGLLMIPVTLMIAATALVFGPVVGGLCALAGALLSASVTYGIGRQLGRDTVRRLAGRRLNKLSQRLGRRGLLAVVIVRLLPVAPFSIINIVAGASHIGWRDFLLGTAIGLLFGVTMATLFVDRALAAIREPGPLAFALLAAIATLIVAVGWIARRKLGRDAATAGARAVATHAG